MAHIMSPKDAALTTKLPERNKALCLFWDNVAWLLDIRAIDGPQAASCTRWMAEMFRPAWAYSALDAPCAACSKNNTKLKALKTAFIAICFNIAKKQQDAKLKISTLFKCFFLNIHKLTPP